MYDYVSNSTGHYDDVVWINPLNTSFESLPEYKTLRLFFVFLKLIKANDTDQAGILLDTGDDFRYPPLNMSYVLDFSPCPNTTKYDSRCLKAYNDPSTLIQSNLSLYYEQNITLFYKSAKVFTYFLPNNFFTQDYYSDIQMFIICSQKGNKIYQDNHYLIQDIFDYNISSLLESQGYEISDEIDRILVPGLAGNSNQSNYFNLIGFNSEYLAAFYNVQIEQQNYIENLVSIVIINQNYHLINYNNLLDNVYNTVIVQVSVFFTFILLGIITTYRLSLFITNQITIPLDIIDAFLKGNIKSMPKLNYSKEINNINRHLKIFEVLEHVINPRFLLNPNLKFRLENLLNLNLLFQALKNNIGISITKNLIANIYLDFNQYDQAIDYYREALSEVEVLYKDIVAQEHAESKLSYKEKTVLKSKTNKQVPGWESEKKLLSSNIIRRLQQLYMAKQLCLEASPESVHSLRNDWKEILELQAKVLQYYINASNNYIGILNILLDVSYVYYKLQYYHTAVEILDIVNNELLKINSEYDVIYKNNSKPYTIDIDIGRLKRLGIKIKDSESRKLYFNPENFSFEKDVLMQKVLYRYGLIHLDNYRFQEAVTSFTDAIVWFMQEYGVWYDPEIRKFCVERIYSIYADFELLKYESSLVDLYENYYRTKRSVALCLYYDIVNESAINDAAIEFVREEVQSQNENFGAVAYNNQNTVIMEIIERDYPDLDLRNLINTIKTHMEYRHIYDLILKAVRQMPSNASQYIIIVIAKGLHNNLGPARIEDIIEEISQIKIIFVCLDGAVSEELVAFLSNYSHTLINDVEDIHQALEALKTTASFQASRRASPTL